jgi:hypothetical protein
MSESEAIASSSLQLPSMKHNLEFASFYFFFSKMENTVYFDLALPAADSHAFFFCLFGLD